MCSIKWSADYSVNIRSIDNEHKLLIELINDIDCAMETGQPVRQQIVTRSLKQLLNFTGVHFESEERFLLLNNYEGFDAHQEEHRSQLRKLDEFTQKFTSEAQVFSEDSMLFLKDWLLRHILLRDSQFGHHFKDHADLILT